MLRRTLVLLAVATFTVSPLAADETITIGTSPAPTSIWYLDDDESVGQTFTVPRGAYLLTSITLWFQPSPFWGWYAAHLDVQPGPEHPDPGDRWSGVDFEAASGRTTFTFDPIRVRPGEMFSFWLYDMWDVEAWEATGAPLDFHAGIELTDRDAYAGGTFRPSLGDVNAGRDIRFEATFVTPEPVSMVLLGTGLMGIAGVRRRRRRG